MTRYVTCPKCGFANSPYRITCKNCAVNLKDAIEGSITETPTDDRPVVSPEERHRILEREIAKYVYQGYRVVSQGETTAQLVRPKEFNFLAAILTLLIYLLYYLAQNDESVYIEVTPTGTVKSLSN